MFYPFDFIEVLYRFGKMQQSPRNLTVITPFFKHVNLTLQKPVHATKHGIKSTCPSNGIIRPRLSETVRIG